MKGIYQLHTYCYCGDKKTEAHIHRDLFFSTCVNVFGTAEMENDTDILLVLDPGSFGPVKIGFQGINHQDTQNPHLNTAVSTLLPLLLFTIFLLTVHFILPMKCTQSKHATYLM